MSRNISCSAAFQSECALYDWFDSTGTARKNVRTYAYFGTTSEISDYVEDITIDGGVSNMLGNPQPTRCTIRLANHDRRFSDLYASSEYAGYLNPNTQILIQCQQWPSLIEDPDDLTTANWSNYHSSDALLSSEFDGHLFTQVGWEGAGALVQQALGALYASSATYSAIVRKGTSSFTYLNLRDTTAAENRGYLTITWATANVSLDAGVLKKAVFYDATTVEIEVQSPSIISGNLHSLYLYAGGAASSETSLFTKVGLIDRSQENSETITLFLGRVNEQGWQEDRAGSSGWAVIDCFDGAARLQMKEFEEDVVIQGKKLVGTSATTSVLHDLLITYGGLTASEIVTNGVVEPTVPYYQLKKGVKVWTAVQDVARASLASFCGFRIDGAFEIVARRATGWAEPSSEVTITIADIGDSVKKEVVPLLGNHIKVRGTDFEIISSEFTVWELRKIKEVGKNSKFPDYCWETVADGDYYLGDPGATPPVDYIAEYSFLYGEIVKVWDPVIKQAIYEEKTLKLDTGACDLDYSPTSGKLALYNNTGKTLHVLNLQVVARAVVKKTVGRGRGTSHHLYGNALGHRENWGKPGAQSNDDNEWGRLMTLSNVSSETAYGTTWLTISSDLIVDDTQMLAIGDYWLKVGKDPRRRWTIEKLPFLAYIQPAAMVTLDVTNLGFNSDVDVMRYTHHITPETGETTLTLEGRVPAWAVTNTGTSTRRVAAPVAGGGSIGQGGVGKVGIADGAVGSAAMTFGVDTDGADPRATWEVISSQVEELFDLFSPDLISTAGRIPSAREVSWIHGTAVENWTKYDDPWTKFEGYGSAGIFCAKTNLITEPEDLSGSLWYRTAATSEIQTTRIRGSLWTKITCASSGTASVRHDVAVTGTSATIGVTIMRGNATATSETPAVALVDWSSSATVGGVIVNWAAQTVTAWATGRATEEQIDAKWISSSLVDVMFAVTGIIPGNTNCLHLYPTLDEATSEYAYFSRVMVSEGRHPSAWYTPTARATQYAAWPLSVPYDGSVEGWCRPMFGIDQTNYHHAFILGDDDATVGTVSLRWDSALGMVARIYKDASNYRTSYMAALPSSPTMRAWHHYLVSWSVSSETLRFFWDGVEQTGSSASGSVSSMTFTESRFTLGANITSETWHGLMNDVMLRSVTSESTTHYSSEVPWYDPSEITNPDASVRFTNSGLRGHNTSAIFTDTVGRSINVSAQAGLEARDMAGIVIHDIPDAPLLTNAYYMGHYYKHKDDATKYTLLDDSTPIEGAWTSLNVLTDGNTNLKGVRLKYYAFAQAGAGVAQIRVVLRPYGSSWGYDDFEQNEGQHLTIGASYSIIKTGTIDCPVGWIGDTPTVEYWLNLSPGGAKRIVFTQVGLWC